MDVEDVGSKLRQSFSLLCQSAALISEGGKRLSLFVITDPIMATLESPQRDREQGQTSAGPAVHVSTFQYRCTLPRP